MSSYINKLAKDTKKKVVDAKKGLILKVTSKDIDKAEQMNPSLCGFAQAAMRQYKAKSAHFFRSVAWLETPRTIIRFTLPGSMQKEIVAFDRSKAMEPGTYKLSAVCPTRTLDAMERRRIADRKAKRSHEPKGKNPGTTRFRHSTQNVRVVPHAK